MLAWPSCWRQLFGANPATGDGAGSAQPKQASPPRRHHSRLQGVLRKIGPGPQLLFYSGSAASVERVLFGAFAERCPSQYESLIVLYYCNSRFRQVIQTPTKLRYHLLHIPVCLIPIPHSLSNIIALTLILFRISLNVVIDVLGCLLYNQTLLSLLQS